MDKEELRAKLAEEKQTRADLGEAEHDLPLTKTDKEMLLRLTALRGDDGATVVGNTTMRTEDGTGKALHVTGETQVDGQTTITGETIIHGKTTVDTGDLHVDKSIIQKNGILSETGGVRWLTGTGAPEGRVTGAVGSLYMRTDGNIAAGENPLHVKTSGTGNTGWLLGAKGDKGDKGNTGPTGPKGANGSNGSPGAKGPPGPPGSTSTGGFSQVGQHALLRSVSGGKGGPGGTHSGGSLAGSDCRGVPLTQSNGRAVIIIVGGTWQRHGYQGGNGAMSDSAQPSATTVWMRKS